MTNSSTDEAALTENRRPASNGPGQSGKVDTVETEPPKEKPLSLGEWTKPIPVLTLIMVVLTASYVYFSYKLWRETQASVSLTRDSLRATEDSLELTARSIQLTEELGEQSNSLTREQLTQTQRQLSQVQESLNLMEESNRISQLQSELVRQQVELEKTLATTPLFRTEQGVSGGYYQLLVFNEGPPLQDIKVDTLDFLTMNYHETTIPVFYWGPQDIEQNRVDLLAWFTSSTREPFHPYDSRQEMQRIQGLCYDLETICDIISILHIEYTDLVGGTHRVCYWIPVRSYLSDWDTSFTQSAAGAEICEAAHTAFLSFDMTSLKEIDTETIQTYMTKPEVIPFQEMLKDHGISAG